MLHGAPAEDEPPEKMRTVQLGDLLDDNQMQGVMAILNRRGLDNIALTKALKAYLAQFRDDLERKGIDDAYLAYLLTYMAPQLRAAAARNN